VRRDLLGAARALLLPTLALIGLALIAPGRLELGARIYALIVCATAIVLVLLALRRAYPGETPHPRPASAGTQRTPPPDLERIEHEVALAVAGSFDLHYRLVPRLRALAAGLLSARRNVSLEKTPERARALVGEEAWALVRPDRGAPEERLGKGIAVSDLGRVVDSLERF
jgi:hypothetical protein